MSKAKSKSNDVITLLDSDSDDEVVAFAASSATSRAARKSSKNNDKVSAPFIPFHLYATATSRTNDAAAKKYFQSLREMIGMEQPSNNNNNKQSSRRRRYQWLIIFNFLIDFSYVQEQLLPDLLKFHRVIVFYGSDGGNPGAMEQWKQLLAGSGNTVEFIPLIPSDPPRSRTNPLSIKIPYGVHHTKMFLMGYEDENNVSMCRVVIHTANLHMGDCEYKTQGAYCQDFPLKQSKGEEKKISKVVNPYKKQKREEGDDATKKRSGWPFDEEEDVPFEEDLVTYLESYRYLTRQSWCSPTLSTPKSSLSHQPMSWLQLIRQYDFSNAYAVLIPSVPGRHKDDTYHNFGYLKLRRAIIDWVCPQHDQQNGTKNQQPSSIATPPPPILCQFSSIGSLNEKWLDHFLSAIDYSLTQDVDPIITTTAKAQSKGKGGTKEKSPPLSSRMKIIWPTMDEIRTSVEGYQGGAAVPGKINNLSKEFLQPLFHRWSKRLSHIRSNANRDPLKTARHIPHIKTFIQPSSSIANGIEWLVLTSHNLSIAAWGQLQKRSDQSRTDEKILFIRHWELGVFMSPATLANRATGMEAKDNCIIAYPDNGNSNGVINLDSDDDEENEEETSKVVVPVPFSMDPDRYDTNDIPWAIDRSCSLPDTFGCIKP